MGTVRLFAIAIDEVRDIFGAEESMAARLRTIAADRFSPTAPAPPGLLGKLGPLFRRAPEAPVVRPGVPSGSDVEALLSGGYVAPARLSAAWLLLETWLSELAWGSLGRDVDEARVNDFDFDLARAGVPTRYGLRSLLSTSLGLALSPPPGLSSGWVSGPHVAAMTLAWRDALPELKDHRDSATTLLDWLDQFGSWTAAARAAERQPPDLISILQL